MKRKSVIVGGAWLFEMSLSTNDTLDSNADLNWDS